MSFEIGADDYLVGADDVEQILSGEELIGMSRYSLGAEQALAKSAAMSQAMTQALAMKRAQSGTLVRSAAPTKSRQYVIGLDSVATIAAAAVANVTNNPQVIFRPERLVISANIAPSFTVNDLRVGKNSQFCAAGSLPADAFGPNAAGVRLKCDTCQVNSLIVLNVTNISLAAARFLAAFFGEAVE